MKTLQDIIREEGVEADKGQTDYYCRCPKCSDQRRPENRNKKVMRVKVDDRGVRLTCMHCGTFKARFFDEGEKFNGGRTNGHGHGTGTPLHASAPGLSTQSKIIARSVRQTWDALAADLPGDRVPERQDRKSVV